MFVSSDPDPHISHFRQNAAASRRQKKIAPHSQNNIPYHIRYILYTIASHLKSQPSVCHSLGTTGGMELPTYSISFPLLIQGILNCVHAYTFRGIHI
jgi:hypothetical protein